MTDHPGPNTEIDDDDIDAEFTDATALEQLEGSNWFKPA